MDPNEQLPDSVEIFEGENAYGYLLQVACGLQSQIIGETDIFGQIKAAWKSGAGITEKTRQELAPIMLKLFEDTKEIRTQFVQKIGGQSYGSLVRMLLRERQDDTGKTKPILLVGAGSLAQSVAPYLLGHELWIWNRSRLKAEQLAFELRERNPQEKIRVLDDTQELEGWEKAAHVIVCIPVDEIRDPQRITALGASSVIHLGGLQNECTQWSGVEGFYSLDDIFERQKQMDLSRERQLERAKKACLERALHRGLGHSLSLAHGWEDLAVFA